MRITPNIDDALYIKAARLNRIEDKSALLNEGLTALIGGESARSLAVSGSSEPDLQPIPRRQTDLAK